MSDLSFFGLIASSLILCLSFVGCLMFPEVVAETSSAFVQSIRVYFQVLGRHMDNLQLQSGRLVDASQSTWHGIRRTLSWHRTRLIFAVLLLLIPPVLILVLKDSYSLGGFADTQRINNPVVTALLEGEQLVPPPPLPPLLFTAPEVAMVRPDLGPASREWSDLDSDFMQRLLWVYRAMKQYGYEMVLLEGYRSPERQNYLASQGHHVTNARAFQSYHQYGLAADSAFLRAGTIVISEKDAWAMRGYELYGQLAESAGLTWGGRWQLRDFGHIELRRSGGLKQLRSSNRAVPSAG